jgi:phosphoribosylaminoimidazole carboxylase (NCAIR synthetase)
VFLVVANLETSLYLLLKKWVTKQRFWILIHMHLRALNADVHIVAPFDDIDALNQLATMCSAVTVEFENPPVTALEHLAQQVTVRPSPSAVAIAQNRREEKQFCQSIGLSVAPYEVLETEDDVARITRNGVRDTS